MVGLVSYASSDEEDEPQTIDKTTQEVKDIPSAPAFQADVNANVKGPGPELQQEDKETPGNEHRPTEVSTHQSTAPIGPSRPTVEEETRANEVEAGSDSLEFGQAPGSPYSSNRDLLHHLTLPSVPDMDIPPSPPGSPPPKTNAKFEQFLEMKKKGTHFNARLEASTALRNPSLMDKLISFAGIDEHDQQYETTLPQDLWNPGAFPEWAFRTRLRESRDALVKEREAERNAGGRAAVEFVPSASSSTSGMPGPAAGISKPGSKRKNGWN